jgi:hypothetical protein
MYQSRLGRPEIRRWTYQRKKIQAFRPFSQKHGIVYHISNHYQLMTYEVDTTNITNVDRGNSELK